MASTPQRETDLYEPVRDHLLARGYTVRAEVRGCDIAAYKDGRIVVVELKRQLNVDLLIQAVDRQGVADSVYIAVPAPHGADRVRRTRGLRRLLRRLGLGLLYIDPGLGGGGVRTACDPAPSRKPGTSKARLAMLEEMIGRSGGQNLGGSTRREIVTAYRETALYVAVCLDRYGPLSPQTLRALGAGAKTAAVLYRNVYGWFDHPRRGVYALSQQGRLALHRYSDLARTFSEMLDRRPGPEEAA